MKYERGTTSSCRLCSHGVTSVETVRRAHEGGFVLTATSSMPRFWSKV